MGNNIKEHMKFTLFLEGRQGLAMATKAVLTRCPKLAIHPTL